MLKYLKNRRKQLNFPFEISKIQFGILSGFSLQVFSISWGEIALIGAAVIFRELSGREWSIVCRLRAQRRIFRRGERSRESSLARERAAALDRQRYE